jgi:hypothetical protein
MSVITLLGVNLADAPSSAAAFKVGTQGFSDDGRVCVYGITSAAINPSTSCTVSTVAVFSVAATGRWISQASVTAGAAGTQYLWFATSATPSGLA